MNASPLALALALLAQDRPPDRPFEGPAALCGSEIPWAGSLEEARERARRTGRPIAWWVPFIEGSPMDRKLVLEKYLQAGPFMMPRVVAALSDHFVPLRLPAAREHRRTFGLEPLSFIEPGLVLLDAEGKVLHRVQALTTFSEDWLVALLGAVLEKAGRKADLPPPPSHPAWRALREGRPDPDLFAGLETPEARYFRGAALFLRGRDDEGRAEWRRIRDGRWAWKAAAELSGDGPFARGFEIYEAPPEDALRGLPSGTTHPRAEALVPRALRFLRGMQRRHGGWDDSNYTFGGADSLPNVYMAVTALAAAALRAWGDPAEIRDALARAEAYMKDESRTAPLDTDEIVWAHAYRLFYFAGAGDRELSARFAAALVRLQGADGAWAHEYENPFVTATALLALDEARRAGAEVPEAAFRRAAEALRRARDPRGVFSYAYPERGGAVEGAAGRMPLCELALLRAGRSDAASVRAALATSWAHHGLLERVRKYDDHADAHRNGGFFFWYDQHGRALAARAAGDRDSLARQRRVVLETQEFDGAWVDSHELGRVYGTAQALLTLKLCAE